MQLPDDLRYSSDHEWVRLEDGKLRVGITDYAALPARARSYLERLQELVGVPITIVSTGPGREQTILRQNPFD